MAIEYKKGKEHFLPAYRLKGEGQNRYEPQELLKNILTELRNEQPNLFAERRVVVLAQTIADVKEHAEMQLWAYLRSTLGITAAQQIQEIGVSKPCCHKCAKVLDNFGVDYSAWSYVANAGTWWSSPGLIIPENLKVHHISLP